MMGGTNTKYISDLSDSSTSDEETDGSNEIEVRHIPNTSVDITTDAAFRASVTLPKATEVLNLAKVLEIEKSLDVEEIVSMVFLLFDDTQYALQELYLMLRGSGKKLLHAWANIQEGRRSNWQNPFIEALCVIKNYEVLRSLGYRKDLSVAHFVPHIGLISLNLNVIKKVSFIICEQLNSAKTKTLLDHVAKQFPQQNSEFGGYNLHYLELSFMNWEVTKTVTLFDIMKILKLMEEEHLCNLLEDVLSKSNIVNENEQSTPFKILQYQQHNVQLSTSAVYDSQSLRNAYFESNFPSTSKSNRIRNTSTTSVDNDHQQEYDEFNPFMDFHLPVVDITRNAEPDELDNRYKVDPDKPGIVLILNQENFYTEVNEQYQKLLPPNTTEKLESRIGTKKDKEDLEKVFKKYGFMVIVENDLTHIEMLDKIKEVVNLVQDESSLFICILSHGDKGIVYGSNSCRVKVNQIKDIMYRTNKAHLTDKPKILILQSCQGQQCQKIDDDDEEEEYNDNNDTDFTTDGPSAPLRDMFTFWATLPGYAAIRNRKTGSWFIQALCKKMVEIGNKHHFADICTRIKNEVAQQVWSKNETDKKAMTPYVQSTLLKDFYLPPLKT